MNKRSTWMVMTGLVLSVACRTGDCGTTTLNGDTGTVGKYTIRVVENRSDPFEEGFGISVVCRMCHGYSDECSYVRPIHTTAAGGRGSTIESNMVVRWQIRNPDVVRTRLETLVVNATCPGPGTGYYNRPGGLGISWGGAYVYEGNPSLVVTGYGGIWGTVASWRDYVSSTGWDLPIRADGSGPGTAATPVRMSLSYAESIVLEGRGKATNVIYDVVGNGGLLIEMHGPAGLACVRRSDGAEIRSRQAVTVGPGDTISCVNKMVTPGKLQGVLDVTAMIK